MKTLFIFIVTNIKKQNGIIDFIWIKFPIIQNKNLMLNKNKGKMKLNKLIKFK